MISEDREWDPLTSAEILNLLSVAENVNMKVAKDLDGEYSDDVRVVVLLGYLNLALDHHQAIVLLVRNRLFSSALALVRVLFELMMRTGWVAKCASCDEVTLIAECRSEYKYPTINSIASQLDDTLSKEVGECQRVFTEVKDGVWKTMNSYTHSGGRQLECQFNGSRVEANYKPAQVVDCLRIATSCLIRLAVFVAEVVNSPKTRAIDSLYDRVPDPVSNGAPAGP